MSLDFCTEDGEQYSFFDRLSDEAIESYTMKEVFSVDSSVRIKAIENLGKKVVCKTYETYFHVTLLHVTAGRSRGPRVVKALLRLLKDSDVNTRTVAAISLARTGESSEQVVQALLKTLEDDDRLVRESGCLALAKLKVKEAVPKILFLWLVIKLNFMLKRITAVKIHLFDVLGGMTSSLTFAKRRNSPCSKSVEKKHKRRSTSHKFCRRKSKIWRKKRVLTSTLKFEKYDSNLFSFEFIFIAPTVISGIH